MPSKLYRVGKFPSLISVEQISLRNALLGTGAWWTILLMFRIVVKSHNPKLHKLLVHIVYSYRSTYSYIRWQSPGRTPTITYYILLLESRFAVRDFPSVNKVYPFLQTRSYWRWEIKYFVTNFICFACWQLCL